MAPGRSALDIVFETSPIADLVCELASSGWRGAATELLATLAARAGPDVVRKKNWPSRPAALSNLLRRDAPALRGVGVEVIFDREPNKGRKRRIVIQLLDEDSGVHSVHNVRPEQNYTEDGRTSTDDADGDLRDTTSRAPSGEWVVEEVIP